jgi:RNA polymerase sigma-70 factor (ECF subfamily)
VPTEIERLYREHRAGLVRLVELELRDHHEAEDVVQTAFLDAQRALERGTIPRDPRAWLAAIALNAARRLRRRRLNAEPLEEYAVQEASGMSDLRAALASLPKSQRAAVLYRDLLGLSYGETADQMGTTVNAVTMLLHRGRERLRQTLVVTAASGGLWRWLKRAGMPQMAAAKGAGVVVVAAGLATAGVVAARVVAPIGSDATAALVPQSESLAAGAPLGRALAPGSVLRRLETSGSSRASAASSTGATTLPSMPDTAPPSQAPSRLGLPAVSLPAVSLPRLPIPTSPATMTLATPITTATVTVPLGTTATVTTPLVTVTLPIP